MGNDQDFETTEPYSTSAFTDLLETPASIHVLDVLLRKYYTEVSVTDLVRLTGEPREDVEEAVTMFENAGFVVKGDVNTRYRLNTNNDILKYLEQARQGMLSIDRNDL